MKAKRILARSFSAMVGAMLTVTACVAPASALTDMLTDLNGDGVVNVFDLILAKRESVAAAHPLIIDVNEQEAMPNDTIHVDVKLQNNPGFASATFMLHYDTSGLELVYDQEAIAYTYDEDLADTTAMVLPSGVHGSVVCVAENSTASEKDATLFSIQFTVLDSAEANASYSISISDTLFYDSEGIEISSLLIEKGAVTIPARAANGTKNERKPFAFGVDVSKWQGDIRWDEVLTDSKDVAFAMIRAGSGSGDPSYRSDPYFAQHYEGAVEAGLPVGAYWYSYALTPEAAVAEAETCMAVLGDRAFQYPIAFDVERPQQWAMSAKDFSAIIDAFCSTMEENGYYVVVYSSASPLTTLYTQEMRKKYGVWVAQYAPNTYYDGDYGMWQFSCTGKVNGIDCDVDLNYSYYDYPTMIENGGFNHCTPST